MGRIAATLVGLSCAVILAACNASSPPTAEGPSAETAAPAGGAVGAVAMIGAQGGAPLERTPGVTMGEGYAEVRSTGPRPNVGLAEFFPLDPAATYTVDVDLELIETGDGSRVDITAWTYDVAGQPLPQNFAVAFVDASGAGRQTVSAQFSLTEAEGVRAIVAPAGATQLRFTTNPNRGPNGGLARIYAMRVRR